MLLQSRPCLITPANESLQIARIGAIELANSICKASETTNDDLRSALIRLSREQVRQIASILGGGGVRTECAECDRTAVGFHGKFAYCREHMPTTERKFKPTSLQIDVKHCGRCGQKYRWNQPHTCTDVD